MLWSFGLLEDCSYLPQPSNYNGLFHHRRLIIMLSLSLVVIVHIPSRFRFVFKHHLTPFANPLERLQITSTPNLPSMSTRQHHHGTTEAGFCSSTKENIQDAVIARVRSWTETLAPRPSSRAPSRLSIQEVAWSPIAPERPRATISQSSACQRPCWVAFIPPIWQNVCSISSQSHGSRRLD